MAVRSVVGASIDELMRWSYESLLQLPLSVRGTRGLTSEMIGCQLELTSPLSRASSSETRGKLFGAFGELFWYLSGSNDANAIGYYLSRYMEDSDENNLIPGGYGPRIIRSCAGNQLENVITLLRERPQTRRAVIQIFKPEDTLFEGEIPCTCHIQFLLRDGRLNLIVSMRSNDAFIGLTHDIFCFTMIQEIIARSIGSEMGTYIHLAGSLHLYEDAREEAETYLGEGIQSSQLIAPSMPSENLWPSILTVAEAERSLRLFGQIGNDVEKLHPYWRDVVRIFELYRARFKDRDKVRAKLIHGKFAHRWFEEITSSRIDQIEYYRDDNEQT
ncbi:MAG: thymidylate synthase [Proteobacteria bacterium]|nr:MAG: thymidylate synthase [Pseudomonadota bacterium]